MFNLFPVKCTLYNMSRICVFLCRRPLRLAGVACARTSFSWLEPMLSMAMGLLGALLPDMSCSVRMCGDWRGGGADAEPPGPVGPMLGAGGEGGTSPATAWTV